MAAKFASFKQFANLISIGCFLFLPKTTLHVRQLLLLRCHEQCFSLPICFPIFSALCIGKCCSALIYVVSLTIFYCLWDHVSYHVFLLLLWLRFLQPSSSILVDFCQLLSIMCSPSLSFHIQFSRLGRLLSKMLKIFRLI